MTGVAAGPAVALFELHRDHDVSGVSGTGVVATGVEFADPADVIFPDGELLQLPAGWCRITWLTVPSSTTLFPSVDDVLAIHGHGGRTRLVWV